MYWEGVKADYYRSGGEALVVATNVRKTVVEYGSERMRYSLRCNCTPDVAINRVRAFPDVFRERVGWEIFGGVHVSENVDSNMFVFVGAVRRDGVVIEVPGVMGSNKLFSEVVSELKFQERYVEKRPGVYSYYNGLGTRYFDSIEEVFSYVVGNVGEDDVREVFGEEFFRLFPGSKTYFRDFGRRMTVYFVRDSAVILSGPGYEISFTSEGADGLEEVLEWVFEEVPGRPGKVYIVGDNLVKGSYYMFEDGFYVEYDVRSGPVYSKEVLDVGLGFDALGGIIGGSDSVLVFDDFLIVVLGKLGVVQKVKFSRRPRRFGSMYRYLYFAPHADAFSVPLRGDVGVAVFMAVEEVLF